MKALQVLKELEDYKKNSSKIDNHLYNLVEMLNDIQSSKFYQFLKEAIRLHYIEVVNKMTINDKTKTFLLNCIHTIIKNHKAHDF